MNNLCISELIARHLVPTSVSWMHSLASGGPSVTGRFRLKLSISNISQSTFFTPYHGWVTMILRVPWARVISQKSAKKHFLVLGAADLTKSHISWFLTWKNEIRISNHSLSQSSNVLVALAQLQMAYSKVAFSKNLTVQPPSLDTLSY